MSGLIGLAVVIFLLIWAGKILFFGVALVGVGLGLPAAIVWRVIRGPRPKGILYSEDDDVSGCGVINGLFYFLAAFSWMVYQTHGSTWRWSHYFLVHELPFSIVFFVPALVIGFVGYILRYCPFMLLAGIEWIETRLSKRCDGI